MRPFRVFCLLFAIGFISCKTNNQNQIYIKKEANGFKLLVAEKNFIINGMNWDYIPIGTNYSYDFWNKPDNFIKSALDTEMKMLQEINVNAIRVYVGIPKKWITYIYKNYGIYTMLNHSFGRYGLTVNGTWKSVTDYRDLATQKVLLSEITDMVNTYKNTPGLLLYLLGNENNYGLFWSGAETEDFPDDDEMKKEMGEVRGRPMYKLFNKAALKIKSLDTNRPVAICNGDLLYIDIIAEECENIDIFGTNIYRGASFTNAFLEIKNKINKPVLFTEFGSDAFNSITEKEDQEMQAYYLKENWKEIYLNTANKKLANNSIGGFTFQFSDGWWKFGQTKDLHVHNQEASWSNGGYAKDLKEKGTNNMNEEWFGICAKGKTDANGFYKLKPRAAYYILKEIHKLDIYKSDINSEKIEDYFSKINIKKALNKAQKN